MSGRTESGRVRRVCGALAQDVGDLRHLSEDALLGDDFREGGRDELCVSGRGLVSDERRLGMGGRGTH